MLSTQETIKTNIIYLKFFFFKNLHFFNIPINLIVYKFTYMTAKFAIDIHFF